MTEKQIQSKKIKDLEAAGFYVIKLMKTNKNGIPDILAIPRGSNVVFVEVKAKSGVMSELQKFRKKELESFDLNVEIYKPE